MAVTVTIYLDTLRECTLYGVAEQDLPEAEAMLDERLDEYLDYIRSELGKNAELETRPGQHTYSVQVDSDDYEEQELVRAAYYGVKDFWDWIN